MVVSVSANAQQKTPTILGSLKGVVKDSVNNIFLKSATVSIYKSDDNSLLSYQITNNEGEFSIKNLPTSILLRLEISHLSYQGVKKTFSIPANTNFIDFHILAVAPSSKLLKEVVVSVPPISINGDTLEVNASAFKLDTNAVVEDLLKRIPNITVWGDGVIIVNGREIRSVLVNGKKFFGGNAIIATQNIPKDAVEKIQVYNTAIDQSKSLDSLMEMNIKLKKGKEFGYFGKFSSGYGTNKKYETDFNINAFTSKMQIAVVGALNNVNKSPNSIATLMNNSTFRSNGTNIAYQPDFKASGVTRSAAVGATFTYDFIERPNLDNKKVLNVNYFLQQKNKDYISNTETTTLTGLDGDFFDLNNTSNKTNVETHNLESRFEMKKKHKSLIIMQSFVRDHDIDNSEYLKKTSNELNVITSTNKAISTGSSNNDFFSFTAQFKTAKDDTKQTQRFGGLNMLYTLHLGNGGGDRLNIVDFNSFTNPLSDSKFNRKYIFETSEAFHQLSIEVKDIKGILFGKANLGGIDLSINNLLKIKTNKDENIVEDFINSNYDRNAYLSNLTQVNSFEDMPSFSLYRVFRRGLANRFDQSWSINANVRQLFQSQDIRSQKSFQNLKRNYSKFIPEVSLEFSDNQYGEHSRIYSIKYSTSVRIPTLSQLAPLIDSANIYTLFRGNINLKESITRTLSFDFTHNDRRKKNPFNYSLNLVAGHIDNNIIDSIFISEDNRRTIFLTNSDGSRFLNFFGSIRKSIKQKTTEIQLQLTNLLSLTKSPIYLNNLFLFTKNLNTVTNLSCSFNYKDYIVIEAKQSFSTYKAIQQAQNTQYSGANMASSLNSTYNINKHVSLNSSITFNSSKYANANVVNFTIWNANVHYRFLKGKNAELKFSALDLLRNNKSIVNFSTLNSFTIGTQNALQNYFMTSIAYYPRQFGKKPAK